MGIDYENIHKYNYNQYDNFMPIMFFNKKEEETNELFNEKKMPERKQSKENNIENSIYSHSRRSTLDFEEEFKSDINFPNKNDNLENIFKNPNNSAFFQSKKEINLFLEDEYCLNINEKENIRKSYYSKLIYKKIWIPGNKSKTHNSLFIYDWDDTFLPTSYLIREDMVDKIELPDELKYHFFILEEIIINILNLSINKGRVYIITNSSKSWFNFSSGKYFPNMDSLLKKIKIISARDEYEDLYPGDTKIWKQKAFLHLKNDINDNLPSNIICFGDSLIEIEAGKIFASHLSDSFLKTVKFKEKPEVEDLIKQLNLIVDKFDFIYSKAKNLSIKVEQKS
jgi:hypothetical protein